MSERLSGNAGIIQHAPQPEIYQESVESTGVLDRLRSKWAVLLATGTLVLAASLAAQEQPAHAAAAAQATIGMPFEGKWAYSNLTNASCGPASGQTSHPSCHENYSGDWAVDLYASAGTEVKLSVSSSDPLSFTWDTSASGSCGETRRINILANKAKIGSLSFTHLTGASSTNNAPSNGMVIGKVANLACNPGGSIKHVHAEFDNNTSTYSCHKDYSTKEHTAGISLSEGADLGIIGSSNTGAKQACASVPNAPPPPVDTDHDGMPDNRDSCPNIWGWSADGCPVKSDFNRDGRADLAAFYGYDGSVTNMWNWNGYANGDLGPPGAPWTGNGWEGGRIIPAGNGDFNGDGKQDIAAFYRHNNGMMDLNIWYGDGGGNFFPVRAWHVDSAWEGERLISAGVGDFNRDGRDDIAAFYRYDNNFTNLWVWSGQDNEYTSSPRVEWSGPGWDGNRFMPTGVSDSNNDKKLDIVTFYRHDNGMMDMNTWLGNGGGGFDLTRPWHVDNAWEGQRLTPAGTGDFDHDGYGDVAAFYRYDDGLVNMWVWWGQGGATVSSPNVGWSAHGWDAARIISAGVGNYNGDSKMDIATFYRHNNGMLDMNMWYYNGDRTFTLHRAWHADSAWEGERLTTARY